MIEGVVRSLFSMMNIDPNEAGVMVQNVVADIKSVDERLTRIENLLLEMKGKADDENNSGTVVRIGKSGS